jgi:ankyrin repeat protein
VEEHQAMLNPVDDEEWTPLHFAASKGFKEICIYLVEKNAVIDVKDSAGNTPLHLAASKGQAETVEALVFFGANVTERNAANRLAGEVAATRRIARTIAGLERDLEEEAREDVVTGRLRGEGDEPQRTAEGDEAGEFFDATEMYGFEFSSEETT